MTESSHLRTLRVLDLLFYQRLRREGQLSREELALLFPNLPELIEIHSKSAPPLLPPQTLGVPLDARETQPGWSGKMWGKFGSGLPWTGGVERSVLSQKVTESLLELLLEGGG